MRDRFTDTLMSPSPMDLQRSSCLSASSSTNRSSSLMLPSLSSMSMKREGGMTLPSPSMPLTRASAARILPVRMSTIGWKWTSGRDSGSPAISRCSCIAPMIGGFESCTSGLCMCMLLLASSTRRRPVNVPSAQALPILMSLGYLRWSMDASLAQRPWNTCCVVFGQNAMNSASQVRNSSEGPNMSVSVLDTYHSSRLPYSKP